MSNEVVIYTDGGSRGNPGPSAIGVYFKDLNKKYSQHLGKATNNEAEYKAILFTLKKAKQLVGKKETKKAIIEIRSDSQLIVSQLNGKFKIKEEEFWPFFIEIWNLRQDFGEIVFKHISREENKVADSLVNEELDKKEISKLF